MICIIFYFLILFTVANCKNGNVLNVKNDLNYKKTVYTLEQIELIICEHREASYLFKCNFEYAKIDLKSDLEENKRQTICNNKSLNPAKQCQALRNVGCIPHEGLKSWCIHRKAEIEEQRSLWHKIIAVTCHKNLVRHTKICKNGKNKSKEGDKHISPAQIAQLINDDQEFKNPETLVDKSKPKIKPGILKLNKLPKPVNSVIELPYNQILINYIFGESQRGIEKENLILFISHVFEEGDKPLRPIKPALVNIEQGKDKEKYNKIPIPDIKPYFESHHSNPSIASYIANSENFQFLKHILGEGIPNIHSVPFYNNVIPNKSKVNKRLAELLLDYIYDVNRPLDFEEELQLFIIHLFKGNQHFIDESKLRSTLVDIIIRYKPLLHIIKPVNIQSNSYPEKLKPYENLGKPYNLQNLQHILSDKINRISIPSKDKTSKPVQLKPVKFEPAPIRYIPRDEFDVSFIFKIADELLNPWDHADANRNSDSNLKHYNFLIDGQKGHKKSVVAVKGSKMKNDDNDLKESIKENKKYVINQAQSSINDLMISMNIE